MDELKPVTENPWQELRRLTPARIAIGRAGGSLPTREVLDFQLAHARARDAVHLAFDPAAIAAQLEERGRPSLAVQSAAPDRGAYLQRPDLGRRLDATSRGALEAFTAESAGRAEGRNASAPSPPSGVNRDYDVVFVVADGLSALAVHSHALPLFDLASSALEGAGWRLAPVVVASQSRVALGDEIGELLGAEQVVMLIGERPGLSAADSLGIYLTYAPRVGRTDAERNCISNVRPEGLSYAEAARKLIYLLGEARRLKLSGVELKDDSDSAPQLPLTGGNAPV